MDKLFVTVVVTVLALVAQTSMASATDERDQGGEVGFFTADGALDAGDEITFAFRDLLPGAPVQVVLRLPDGRTVIIDDVSVGGTSGPTPAAPIVPESGVGSIAFNLPDALSAGAFTIEVRSTSADGDPAVSGVTFALGQQLGESGHDTLTINGANTPSLVGSAALLAMLGTGFVLVGRRRQSDDAGLINLG